MFAVPGPLEGSFQTDSVAPGCLVVAVQTEMAVTVAAAGWGNSAGLGCKDSDLQTVDFDLGSG